MQLLSARKTKPKIAINMCGMNQMQNNKTKTAISLLGWCRCKKQKYQSTCAVPVWGGHTNGNHK